MWNPNMWVIIITLVWNRKSVPHITKVLKSVMLITILKRLVLYTCNAYKE